MLRKRKDFNLNSSTLIKQFKISIIFYSVQWLAKVFKLSKFKISNESKSATIIVTMFVEQFEFQTNLRIYIYIS